VILDTFGTAGFVVWATVYPILLGLACAALGNWQFSRADLV